MLLLLLILLFGNQSMQQEISKQVDPVSSSSIKRQPVIDVCLGYTDKYTGCLLEFKGRIVAVVV